VASLDGEFGRVKIRDWGREGRTPAGNPIVSDANQTGIQLGSKGWTPGKVVLRTGDYITVNDELKMVTADVTSSAQELPLFPLRLCCASPLLTAKSKSLSHTAF
jgi:hypothetical protein